VVLFCDLLFNGHVEWASLIIGIIVIIFLIAVKVINYFLRKKVKRIPLVIPGSLLALIVTTAISFLADFPERFGISVVGNTSTVFERSTNSVSLPPFTGDCIDYQLMVDPDFVLSAFLLALLIYVLSSSHARVLAKSTGDIIHNHQELIAYGMCNAIGSLFGIVPAASNISRALLQLSFGGKTQLAGIIAGFVVLFFSLFSAPLFSFLPLATLAAVIIVGVDVLLLQFMDLKKFWKLSKWDVITWIVTFLSVIIVNMKIGLLIGFIMSLLIIVLRTVLPVSEALGVATEWDSITRQYESVEKLEGILIYRFQAPLHFANVAVFKSRLQKIASVQLSKQKGNFYDSDGFIPRLVRMCHNRCPTTTGCACCCGKGKKNRFHRLQGDPRFTSSPTQEGLLSDPSPEMIHQEGQKVRFRSPPETSSEHEHTSSKKPQRKTYQAFGSAENKEDLLLHRREVSYEEVVIKPRVNRSPLPRNTKDQPQLENKEVSKEEEGGAGHLVPAIIVEDVDAVTGSGDENNAENLTLDGGKMHRSTVQQVPIDVRSVPREPNYVNVECVPVKQNRNTGQQEGGDFNVTENDYYNLPRDIPQRYQKTHAGGGDGERDYYNVDHLHRGESMKRSSTLSEHSEHSNVDDLCHVPQMASIYVRHAIKRKLVHGENIGDFDDFEELSTSFVRKLEHAREHPYHTIVLDCGPISFIDSAGALLLHQLIKDLSKLGIEFLLAAPSKYFITSFERLGFCRRCSQHFIFPTIQSAVEYAMSAQRQERPLSALLEGSHDEDNPNSIGYVERHVVSNRRFDFESSFSWLGNSGSERHERSREIPSHHRSREDVFTRTV
jgi:MFS superfamily sulfate permease-like transporter